MVRRDCATKGCTKEGKMVCPKCKEMGLPGGYFCDQTCFRKSWPEHKVYHKMMREAAELAMSADSVEESSGMIRIPRSFDGFKFTGPLRPGMSTARVTVPKGIPKPDYADTGIPTSELAIRKTHKIENNTPEQVASMRKACRLAREVMDVGRASLAVGVTPEDINEVIHEATLKRNAYPSPLNYHGFPKSVCTSVNEVICHGIPDDRPLEEGDIVNLDVTIFIDGHHADLNETFCIGNVDKHSKRLVKTAYDCLAKAVDMVRPGTMYRDLGTIITRTAGRENFSVCRSYCGHGIHRLFHCAPSIPHYAKNKAVGSMKVGHTFTIEPMINAGSHHDETWPDGWTAVTRDGKRSAQFEHTMVVVDGGVELLTGRRGAPRDKMVWDEEYSCIPAEPEIKTIAERVAETELAILKDNVKKGHIVDLDSVTVGGGGAGFFSSPLTEPAPKPTPKPLAEAASTAPKAES